MAWPYDVACYGSQMSESLTTRLDLEEPRCFTALFWIKETGSHLEKQLDSWLSSCGVLGSLHALARRTLPTFPEEE